MTDKVSVVDGDVLGAITEDARDGDVLVVDPPRVGLGRDVCARLMAHGPERVVYISCNPVTQIMDCEMLEAGYRIVASRGFDLFPQTLHVENVVILERIRV